MTATTTHRIVRVIGLFVEAIGTIMLAISVLLFHRVFVKERGRVDRAVMSESRHEHKVASAALVLLVVGFIIIITTEVIDL